MQSLCPHRYLVLFFISYLALFGGLTSCSVYQSEGRKFLETQAFSFAFGNRIRSFQDLASTQTELKMLCGVVDEHFVPMDELHRQGFASEVSQIQSRRDWQLHNYSLPFTESHSRWAVLQDDNQPWPSTILCRSRKIISLDEALEVIHFFENHEPIIGTK